jgi:hypothetical protein
VLNVAVSELGKNHVSKEFHNLKMLNAEFAESFLPRVYSMGEVTSDSQRKFCLFLAEWFQDYHEFHISRDTSDSQRKVCVWDDRNGRYYLSRGQTSRLYRQAARIMTYYYNVTTFEHISPWHHAAGDFIIKPDQDNIDLKLITVRGYAPLFKDPNEQNPAAGHAEQIMQALLIFFLKLSLWMRLDRIDGVGEIVWSDPAVVQGTVAGVLDGLAPKPPVPILPDTVDICFKYYLSVCSAADLLELLESILHAVNPTAPEKTLIEQHLAEHTQALLQAIKKL